MLVSVLEVLVLVFVIGVRIRAFSSAYWSKYWSIVLSNVEEDEDVLNVDSSTRGGRV